MKVGIPREVKDNEYRVAITPAGVRELVTHGHDVSIEKGAGLGSSITDTEFVAAGAQIIDSADELWAASELVTKVKEPVEQEFHRLRKDLLLFTYLHLAADRACTVALLEAGTTSIAYETVQLDDGSLPLLAPMSEVAGRMAPLVGSHTLERPQGGRGVLVSGVPGVPPARVVILGAGVAGTNATAIAVGMHADVTVIDRDIARLRALDLVYGNRITTSVANVHAIEEACLHADLVIGAVLVVGARAPRLVSDDLVTRMKPGSVLVDISVDQGGCFESTHPTTHSEPTFTVAESLFYCVANMPGAVPHTSTHALTNATLPYTVSIANNGWYKAARENPALASGLNTVDSMLTISSVANAHDISYTELETVLS